MGFPRCSPPGTNPLGKLFGKFMMPRGKKHSSYITLYNNILGKHCYNIVLSIYYIHYILGKQDIMIYNVSMFPLGKQDITLFIGMEQNTLIQKWSANVGHLFCTNTALW